MVKRREPIAPTDDQIESFAAGASTMRVQLDPTATHDFKGIKVGFNEYEFRILEEASRKTGRSKLNFIRHAILKMAEDLESKQH